MPKNGASAFYRNDLTGLIDHIRLTLDESAEHRIVSAFSRPGYRTEANPAAARSDRVRVARLDDFVDLLASRDLLSGVIIVARNGEPIYQRAIGRRNDAGEATFRTNGRPRRITGGKLTGQKSALKMKEVWSIRTEEARA